MASIKLEIEFDGEDKDGKPTQYTRTFDLVPDKMPLALVEAGDEKKFGLMRRSLKRYLKLTEDESEQITIEHLNQIAGATAEAQRIPNG